MSRESAGTCMLGWWWWCNEIKWTLHCPQSPLPIKPSTSPSSIVSSSSLCSSIELSFLSAFPVFPQPQPTCDFTYLPVELRKEQTNGHLPASFSFLFVAALDEKNAPVYFAWGSNPAAQNCRCGLLTTPTQKCRSWKRKEKKVHSCFPSHVNTGWAPV